MRYLLYVAGLILLASCEQRGPMSSMNPINWEKRSAEIAPSDSLVEGSTYLSVYSEIYDRSEKRTIDLTATVSIRNMSSTDSVFLYRADYYNTAGDTIRSYFDHPVYVAPMETIEIVIDQIDRTGGPGANFIFNWAKREGVKKPYFEAVMISSSGQLGISFTTRGIHR